MRSDLNNTLTVSKEKLNDLRNYQVKKGDIVMGRRGEMGRCALISDRENGWLCGTGSLYMRPNREMISSRFLLDCMSSKSVKEELERVAKGTTMSNLNQTVVGNLSLINPPLEMQKKYEHLVQLAEQQMLIHIRCLKESTHLFQNILQLSFN